jgi:hypothetical protein
MHVQMCNDELNLLLAVNSPKPNPDHEVRREPQERAMHKIDEHSEEIPNTKCVGTHVR